MCGAGDHVINSQAHVYALQLAHRTDHQWMEVMGTSNGTLASKDACLCLSPLPISC